MYAHTIARFMLSLSLYSSHIGTSNVWKFKKSLKYRICCWWIIVIMARYDHHFIIAYVRRKNNVKLLEIKICTFLSERCTCAFSSNFKVNKYKLCAVCVSAHTLIHKYGCLECCQQFFNLATRQYVCVCAGVVLFTMRARISLFYYYLRVRLFYNKCTLMLLNFGQIKWEEKCA